MAKQKSSFVYYKLKDKSNSNGILIGNISFNNATVAKYPADAVPPTVLQYERQSLLTKATEKEFEARSKELQEAAENGKKVIESRRLQSKARVEAASGVVKEEAKKKEAKKKELKDEEKIEEPKEEEGKIEEPKEEEKDTSSTTKKATNKSGK